MRFQLKKLNFTLSSPLFDENIAALEQLTTKLKSITKKAGFGSDKFQAEYSKLEQTIDAKKDLIDAINSSIQVRAFASLLTSSYQENIALTKGLLNKINQVLTRPTALLIESIFQHYLHRFDTLHDCEAVIEWLIAAKASKAPLTKEQHNILSLNGSHWLAEQAIINQLEFDDAVQGCGLANYQNGRFISAAKGIYYVNQLKTIPVNSSHPLLQEVQKTSIYEASFDKASLLGHQVLNILIDRAKNTQISDAWLNTILAIAGDPRIPSDHSRFIKWWQHIDDALVRAVRGWLSKLDLKLFLEALKDFSHSARNDELNRMYPARKQFLEGMFDAGVIVETRLYLSKAAAAYIKRNYEARHLPNFNQLSDSNKSIIYVRMTQGHMIEGSHSCHLWIYRDLHPSALVFDYSAKNPSYQNLTSGLNKAMRAYGNEEVAKIVHNPTHFAWQRKALTALHALGVNLTPKDVIPEEDYSTFKQKYGTAEWR